MKKILFVALIFAWGCSKDGDPDIRENAIGTYNRSIKFYRLNGTSLSYIGSNNDKVSVLVEKSRTDPNTIIFTMTGNSVFKGSNISKNAVGFTFTVPTSTLFDSSGKGTNFTGYDGVEFEGEYFNGIFYNDPKKNHLVL